MRSPSATRPADARAVFSWSYTALSHLGDTHHAARNPAAARTAWRQALDVLAGLNLAEADDVRAKLHHLDQPTAASTPGGPVPPP